MSDADRTAVHRRAFVFGLALVFCLLAGSSLRVVGDGGEYLVQALNFAAAEGPAIADDDIETLTAETARIAPELADWSITSSAVRDARGRHDFYHFWFYALLATPPLWIAESVGINPLLAFVAVNLLVFGVALWMALPRLGVPATLLLFGSPLVWWLDKPHTEVFTFSLLVIALLTLRDRPWWTLLALGAASTQNPPIAVLLAPALLAQWPGGAAHWRDRRLLAGLAGGVGLALLHPVYSYDRHGVASLLMNATSDGIPTLSEVLAFVFDPAIGLVANAPVLCLAIALAAVAAMRHWHRDDGYADVLFASVAAIVFLYAFARTTNFHHGATPSISRYALWLIPLGIPWLWRAHTRAGATVARGLLGLAVVSTAVNVIAFHPAVVSNSREPTWAARWLWTAHPGWNNPLPEIFAETLSHRENPTLPVITPGCEKVLTAGRNQTGVWPMPCYPPAIPDQCRIFGQGCYGNLDGDGNYQFVVTPGRRPADGLIDRQRVWPDEAEDTVRAIFDRMAWRELRPEGPGSDNLRAVVGVNSWVLSAPDRLLIVLQGPEDGAALRFRTPTPVSGQLIAPRSGDVVREIADEGGDGELWEVALPAEHDILILTLRRTPKA